VTKNVENYFHRWQLERVAGIEPVSKAWEAFVLPLNYTRWPDAGIKVISLGVAVNGNSRVTCVKV
jgi:hypothetical protein